MRTLSASSVLCALLAVAGCGGSNAGSPSAETPLTAQQVALFEDGVDMLEDPSALQDSWRTDWDRETRERIAQSDAIALGDVTTVRTQEDPGQAVSYYVVISVKKTLLGEPVGNELVLTARESAAGYGNLADQRERLLRMSVIAFLKYAKEGSAVITHFHLVVPSEPVYSAIDQHKRQGGNEVKIITHTQE